MKGKEPTKKLPAMTARERHRQNLLAYLGVWENPWPKTIKGLAKIVGIKEETLRFHFSRVEINAIYSDSLELRKKNSFAQRKSVYDSMLCEAEDGNVAAQNAFLDRTEGKVTDKVQLGFDSAALNVILSALPDEYAKAVKAQLSEIIKK